MQLELHFLSSPLTTRALPARFTWLIRLEAPPLPVACIGIIIYIIARIINIILWIIIPMVVSRDLNVTDNYYTSQLAVSERTWIIY